MAKLSFAPFIQRRIPPPPRDLYGNTVQEILDAYFEMHQVARSFLLDDQGCLRPRLAVYLDGEIVADRKALSDPVHAHARVFIQNLPSDTEYESL